MNAVATVERTETRPASPQREVRQEIEAMADQFKMALPSHIKVDKFQRVVLTAIMSDPDLLHADRRSLIGAVTRAAQDGLLPDKREGALVIFNQKVSKRGEQDKWIQAVQWMPMIAGVLKKVRQSGEISAITANIIHERDQFTWSMGDDESIEHIPPQLGSERGNPIGVYAIATLKDGYKIREVMDIHEIEKVRKVSKTGQYGPWKDWWEEMAKKTVIRRLSKRLPMSTDIEGVINDESTEADLSRSAMGALGAGPQRLTREALANHANEQESPQSPSPEDSPPVDEGAEAVSGREGGAERQEGAAPSNYTPPSLFEQLTDRLDMADDMKAVDDVQAEFDAREGEIMLADRPALQTAINAAKKRIAEEGN
jgi:recombination protein RecT